MNIVDILIKHNAFPTRGECRMMINVGAINVNDIKITDIKTDVDESAITKIQIGKKRLLEKQVDDNWV